MTAITVTEAALAAYDAGLCVVPVRNDGTKMPALDSWKALQSERPSRETTENWFASQTPSGLGVICGQVSGGLEMLEFEGKAIAEGTYDAFLELLAKSELFALFSEIRNGYMEKTPSGGYHFLYRVSGSGALGNTKLASRPPTTDEADGGQLRVCLCETRGEGGFTVCAPSGGRTHPSGQSWEMIEGGFDSIVTITPEQRNQLFQVCRSLDSMPQQTIIGPAAQSGVVGSRPGDKFSESPDAELEVVRVLQQHGWIHVYNRGEVSYWRRPGTDKTTGISASLNHVAPGVFYVFSANAAPFEPEHAYSPFALVGLLQFGGNFTDAATWCVDKGFGEPLPPVMQREIEASAAGAETRFEATDIGNGQRLVQQHGHRLRYVTELSAWLIWTGTHWQEDMTGEIWRIAKQTAESIMFESLKEEDPDRAKELFKWWKRSQSTDRIRAMVFMAQSELGIPVSVRDLDNDKWGLNCANGIVDLKTGELRPSDPKALHTKLCPVDYDPAATAPTWLSFLSDVLNSDDELTQWLQRGVGYSLTGVTDEQCLFFLHGSGANGKSTFTQTLQSLMGEYSLSAAPDLLVEQRGMTHPTGVADLLGRRFVVSQEIDDGKRLAETLVKQLTGSDRVRARRMHQDFFEFEMTGKLWLAANHKPEIRGTDYAIWRRIKLVPFTVTIPPEKRDAALPNKLLAELPGILAWAVAGCVSWVNEGLGVCDAVALATQSYKDESDVLAGFFEACCVLDSGASVSAKELRNTYEAWCLENGEHPFSARKLGRILTERGFDRQKVGHANAYSWFGFGLTGGLLTQIQESADEWSAPQASDLDRPETRTLRTQIQPFSISNQQIEKEEMLKETLNLGPQGPQGPQTADNADSGKTQGVIDDDGWEVW